MQQVLAAEAAANKCTQERFAPKLVAAGIMVAVDTVRRPNDNTPSESRHRQEGWQKLTSESVCSKSGLNKEVIT